MGINNRVQLLGNLTRDPEVRAFSDGNRIATIGLATTERWKDKQTGERKEATEFHQVVFARGLVDVVQSYLVKGSQIAVEGKLKTRSWEENGVVRYATEVRANELLMLGGKRKEGAPDMGPERSAVPEDDDDSPPW